MAQLKILKPWITQYLTDHLLSGSIDLIEEQITILKKLDATALANYIAQKSPRTIKQLCLELEELLPEGLLKQSPENLASSLKKKKKEARRLRKQSLENLEDIKIEEDSSHSQDEESNTPAVAVNAIRSEESSSHHLRKRKKSKSPSKNDANTHESSHNAEEVETPHNSQFVSQRSPDSTICENEMLLRETPPTTLQVKPLHKLISSPVLADLNLSSSCPSNYDSMSHSTEIGNQTEFAPVPTGRKKSKKKKQDASQSTVDGSWKVVESSQDSSIPASNLVTSQETVDLSSSVVRVMKEKSVSAKKSIDRSSTANIVMSEEPNNQVPCTSNSPESDSPMKAVVLREIFLNFVNFMGSLSHESKKKIEEEILRALGTSAKELQVPDRQAEESLSSPTHRKKSKKKKKKVPEEADANLDITLDENINEVDNLEFVVDSSKKMKRKRDSQLSESMNDTSFDCDISMVEKPHKKVKKNKPAPMVEDPPFFESIDLTDDVICEESSRKKKKKKKRKDIEPLDLLETYTFEPEEFPVPTGEKERTEVSLMENLEESVLFNSGEGMHSEQVPEISNAPTLDGSELHEKKKKKKKKKSRQKELLLEEQLLDGRNEVENNQTINEIRTHPSSSNIDELEEEQLSNNTVVPQQWPSKKSSHSEDKAFNPKLYDFENFIAESVITRRSSSQEQVVNANESYEPAMPATVRPISSQQSILTNRVQLTDKRMRDETIEEQYSSNYSESSEDSSVEVTYHFMNEDQVTIKKEVDHEVDATNYRAPISVEDNAVPSRIVPVKPSRIAPVIISSHSTLENNIDVSSHGQVTVNETSCSTFDENLSKVVEIEPSTRRNSAPVDSVFVDESRSMGPNSESALNVTIISEEPSETVRVTQTVESSSNVPEDNQYRSLEKELLELEHTLYLADKGDPEHQPRTKPAASKDSDVPNPLHALSSPSNENSTSVTTSLNGGPKKASHRCEKCRDKTVVFDNRRDLLSHWLEHVKETFSKIQTPSPSNSKNLPSNLPFNGDNNEKQTSTANLEISPSINPKEAQRVNEQVLPQVSNQVLSQSPTQLTPKLNKQNAPQTNKQVTSQVNKSTKSHVTGQVKALVNEPSIASPQQLEQLDIKIPMHQYNEQREMSSEQSCQQDNIQAVIKDNGKMVLANNLPDVCPNSPVQSHVNLSKFSPTSTKTSASIKNQTVSAGSSSHSDYRCTLCSTVFRNESALKDHLKKHSKPFKCSLCNSSFKTDTTLRSHLVTHSNHKPFKCPQCSTCFKRIGDFNHHRAVFHAVRRFHCKPCKVSFKFRSSLSKHRKEKHSPCEAAKTTPQSLS